MKATLFLLPAAPPEKTGWAEPLLRPRTSPTTVRRISRRYKWSILSGKKIAGSLSGGHSTGAVVGMQDMGAAGIICSTAKISAKGGVGMNIYLDKVPHPSKKSGRVTGEMKAWELLLSESQERMLLTVKKGREKEVWPFLKNGTSLLADWRSNNRHAAPVLSGRHPGGGIACREPRARRRRSSL